MVQDIIYHNGKIYQVSTCKVYDNTCFETMIFPIENGTISGREVYCYHTFEAGESKNKHRDIIVHPEKYVSNEAISEYLKSKEPEPVKKYRYNIVLYGDRKTCGTIDLTEEEAAIVAHAVNPDNWNITLRENDSCALVIDINNPMEIPKE